MENNVDVHKDNESPVSSTNLVKKEAIKKCFDAQAVDDIIESFNDSEIIPEDCDSNDSSVYLEKDKGLLKDQLPKVQLENTLAIKSPSPEKRKAMSKKIKQNRSQVNLNYCHYIVI